MKKVTITIELEAKSMDEMIFSLMADLASCKLSNLGNSSREEIAKFIEAGSVYYHIAPNEDLIRKDPEYIKKIRPDRFKAVAMEFIEEEIGNCHDNPNIDNEVLAGILEKWSSEAVKAERTRLMGRAKEILEFDNKGEFENFLIDLMKD